MFVSLVALLEWHFAQRRARGSSVAGGSSDNASSAADHRTAKLIGTGKVLAAVTDRESHRLLELHFGLGISEAGLADRLEVTTAVIGRRMRRAMRAALDRAVELGLVGER